MNGEHYVALYCQIICSTKHTNPGRSSLFRVWMRSAALALHFAHDLYGKMNKYQVELSSFKAVQQYNELPNKVVNFPML